MSLFQLVIGEKYVHKFSELRNERQTGQNGARITSETFPQTMQLDEDLTEVNKKLSYRRETARQLCTYCIPRLAS